MIYLDSNVFIYSVLDLGGHGKNARKLLKLSEDTGLQISTSSLTFDEVLWSLMKNISREDAIESCNYLLGLRNLKVLNIDKTVILECLNILKKTNLKPRDSIHAATMNIYKIKEIISEDEDFDVLKEIRRDSIGGFIKKCFS